MAIKVDFGNVKTKLPSGDGPSACKHCGGKGYSSYGADEKGIFKYSNFCLEGWNSKTQIYLPCTKSLIGTPDSDRV